MRRSRRNATVLVFTCLIQSSDGSRVSTLISVVGYLGFSLSRFFLSPVRRLPLRCFSSFSPSAHQGGQAGDRDLLEQTDLFFFLCILPGD
jgi:hypothetical protein